MFSVESVWTEDSKCVQEKSLENTARDGDGGIARKLNHLEA